MPKVGEITKLKVKRIVKNGAYLEDLNHSSDEYFLHVAEISSKWINDIHSVLKTDDLIEVRIISQRTREDKKTFLTSITQVDEEVHKLKKENRKKNFSTHKNEKKTFKNDDVVQKNQLKKLMVKKITNNGAYLLDKNARHMNYFLPVSEISNEFVKDINDHLTVGDMIEVRFTSKSFKKGETIYQVSMRLADEKEFRLNSFNKKMDKFLKTSSEIQMQIKKNKQRKFEGRKRKKKD